MRRRVKKKLSVRAGGKHIDFYLLGAIIFLTVFGILMIYNASSVIAFRDFNDKYYYFKEQLIWMILGYASLVFFSFVDYKIYYTFALPILLAAIGMLLAVFIPGLGIHTLGASRWINLGFTSLQPAEFVKLSLAIYLSAWFSKQEKEKERFMSFVLLLGLVFLLIMLQPDMGTASIVLFEGMIVYFLSGGNMKQFLLLVPAVVVGGFALIKLSPYRAARLAAFFGAHQSVGDTSYHVKQILIALGSGGLMGVGLGNSLQKYAYLPENVTDSIFAIIAEELGLIGGMFLVGIYIFIISRGFIIAMNSKDNFGKLLAGALTAFLGIQVVVNLAAMTALIPLTGVPLPFISYGGSALIVDLGAVGMLLNISRHANR
jgi:cell division protein FtsW